jgi:replication fork clamp-binding protein CrfC
MYVFEENGHLLEIVAEKTKRLQEQNQRDRHGNTALHMIAKFMSGNKMSLEVSRILLESEVCPLLKNNDQKTARELTSRKSPDSRNLLLCYEGISIYFTFLD